MSKYLKLFETAAQYESWKSSDDFVCPNVSYAEDGNLYYNPAIIKEPIVLNPIYLEPDNSYPEVAQKLVEIKNIIRSKYSNTDEIDYSVENCVIYTLSHEDAELQGCVEIYWYNNDSGDDGIIYDNSWKDSEWMQYISGISVHDNNGSYGFCHHIELGFTGEERFQLISIYAHDWRPFYMGPYNGLVTSPDEE